MNSKEYKYIIGLDLSLTEPGWAKYDIEKKELTFGIIDVDKTKGFERISLIRDKVDEIIEIITFTDKIVRGVNSLIVLEGYSFASKGNSAISLGELGGVIRYMFYNHGLDYVEVAPTQAKKFLTGKGSAQKSVMIKEVYKNYGVDTDNDNAADAINLCYIGRVFTGNSDKKVTIEQQKLVNAIFKDLN